MTLGRLWIAGLLVSGFLTVFYLATRLVLLLDFIVIHLEKNEINSISWTGLTQLTDGYR